MSATALRAACLLFPCLLLLVVWRWRRGHSRRTTGALLAAAWNLPVLLGLNALAPHVGWWAFDAQGGLVAGVPFDLLLGWSLLWGPVAAFAFRRTHLAVVLALLLWVDVLVMPRCDPLVALGPGWLVGEAAALLCGALPGLLLARWVRDDRRLGLRVSLGVTAFGAWVLGVFPAVAFDQVGGGFSGLGLGGGLGLQLVFLLAVPGLSAAQEFAQRGRGTPLPYDPPRRLVRSGPYAYVANPMQLSGVLVLLAWGALLGSAWVAAAALVCVAYSAGLAAWHEDLQLARRYGCAWTEYRGRVRRWLPSWRPLEGEPAALYVAAGCDPCEGVGSWFLRRGPVALEVLPAQLHPCRSLTRIAYDPGDGGPEEEGLAAVGRALEHLHLGWALLGWTLRLPPIRWLGQLLVDAAGGGPTKVESVCAATRRGDQG